MFCSRFADEVQKTDDDWRTLVRNDSDRQRVFGLFDGDTLIGMSAIFTYRDDPTGETAVLAMSYIEPGYRGRGLARLLYEARLDWARSTGRFKRARVSHRRSNERSRRANQRFGFVESDAIPSTWPDGGRDDEVVYHVALT